MPWRDSKKPSAILDELCRKNHLKPPEFPDSSSVIVNGVVYRDEIEYGTLNFLSVLSCDLFHVLFLICTIDLIIFFFRNTGVCIGGVRKKGKCMS